MIIAGFAAFAAHSVVAAGQPWWWGALLSLLALRSLVRAFKEGSNAS